MTEMTPVAYISRKMLLREAVYTVAIESTDQEFLEWLDPAEIDRYREILVNDSDG